MRSIIGALARILEDVNRTRSIGQLAKIDQSPHVRDLPDNEKEVVAAAVSGRMLAVDYDIPVPRGGA